MCSSICTWSYRRAFQCLRASENSTALFLAFFLPQSYFNRNNFVIQALSRGDEWYYNMKAHNETAQNNNLKQTHLLVAEYPISFHYVDKVESQLLHEILYNKRALNGGNIFRSLLNVCNASDLFRLWPQSYKDLGGYGRALKDLQEAEVFFKFLFCNINIYNSVESNYYRCTT
jgi:hypothetical protein